MDPRRDVALVKDQTTGGSKNADNQPPGFSGRRRAKLPLLIAAGGSFAGIHGASGGSSVHLELWQVINLLGTPLLAIIFAGPVIDDVRAWLTRPDDR